MNDDSHFYYEKYGNFTNEMNHGVLNTVQLPQTVFPAFQKRAQTETCETVLRIVPCLLTSGFTQRLVLFSKCLDIIKVGIYSIMYRATKKRVP